VSGRVSQTPAPVVVITGASSGIGWELALRLAAGGACVALVARRADRLRQLEAQITAGGGVAVALPCDLTDVDALARLPGQVEADLGPVDVLINNAGRGAHGPFDDVDMATHRQVMGVNVDSVVACTHAFLPQMLNRGCGKLVFVSSVLGRLPAPEHAVYAASKWAVSGFAESLAYELQPRGIDVVLVEPGLVQTEFAQQASAPMARFRHVPSKTAAQAAQIITQAIQRSTPHTIADRGVAFVIACKRHVPRLFRLIFGAVYRRAARS